MFFPGNDEQTEATQAAASQATNFGSVAAEVTKTVQKMTDLEKGVTSVFEMFQELIIQSEELNKTFVAGRLRIQEMQKAINEAAPDIVRLGGKYTDVGKTIQDIAAGTRTQIVASSKDVAELFAAGQILGTGVSSIVDSFDKVGISYNRIADNLAESIVYIQGVGQNARAVMKDVLGSTEQLSRFNFANGVQGLTKMAAQASMMRFDMSKTFDFAEKMLDPEAAIEMSSAFQRLGVSVGNLTDPLSLVNQSLTDPSGLQNSLINMTKQFTYFDEQTKSFKINPQGILTMRELANATGISAAELRKTALAAAEMDAKIAKINTTGLNFEVSEENKMLIANLARMDTEGEYEVSIKDDRGNEYQRKLTELTETEFGRLIEQQSKAPKTIEEIQRSQLNTAELMLGELKGLRETMSSAFFDLPNVQSSIESATKQTRDASMSLQKAFETSRFKKELSEIKKEEENIREMGYTPEEEKKRLNELFERSTEEIKKQAPELLRAAGIIISTNKEESNEQVKSFMNSVDTYFNLLFGTENKTPKIGGAQMATPSAYGILSNSYANPVAASTAATAALGLSKPSVLGVEFLNPTLTVNVNVSTPTGMDATALTQVIKDAQIPLQQELYNAVRKVAINKGEIKPVGA